MPTNRRDFMKSAMALGGAAVLKPTLGAAPAVTPSAPTDPLVGKKWPGWQAGHFQFHTIYTGVGEALFLIYPDGTSMLIDCGDHAAINRGDLAVPVLPSGERHAGEWVSRYVQRVNPAQSAVDYMVLTHLHTDHAGCASFHAGIKNGIPLSGFGEAMQYLSFKRAIDRGYPDYANPTPLIHNEPREVACLMNRVYRALKARDGLKVEKVRLGASDQYLPLKDPSACPDFTIKNVAANAQVALPDGTIYNPLEQFPKSKWPHVAGENAFSICQLITYGKFKMLTTGDFSEQMPTAADPKHRIEDDLALAVPRVEVAKIPHHGHRAMSGKLAAALSPQVWLSAVWDQLHDTADTMTRIHRGYAGARLYCPGIFPAERRWEDQGAPWLNDVAPECFKGSHVIVDVPPGGETYTVTMLSARDESMTISGVRHFQTR